eukprot:SAG31_NODE_556_length_14161_cov_3.384943_8_plen_321_part_00
MCRLECLQCLPTFLEEEDELNEKKEFCTADATVFVHVSGPVCPHDYIFSVQVREQLSESLMMQHWQSSAFCFVVKLSPRVYGEECFRNHLAWGARLAQGIPPRSAPAKSPWYSSGQFWSNRTSSGTARRTSPGQVEAPGGSTWRPFRSAHLGCWQSEAPSQHSAASSASATPARFSRGLRLRRFRCQFRPAPRAQPLRSRARGRSKLQTKQNKKQKQTKTNKKCRCVPHLNLAVVEVAIGVHRGASATSLGYGAAGACPGSSPPPVGKSLGREGWGKGAEAEEPLPHFDAHRRRRRHPRQACAPPAVPRAGSDTAVLNLV